MKRSFCRALGAAGLLLLTACDVEIPSPGSIRDLGIFNKRIKETPRQKVLRECTQEGERFRVNCRYCHTTDKAADIQQPDKLRLTASGIRAQVMRASPAFGATQDCDNCHHSKFTLTRSAEKLFGAGGFRPIEVEPESKK